MYEVFFIFCNLIFAIQQPNEKLIFLMIQFLYIYVKGKKNHSIMRIFYFILLFTLWHIKANV